jgi:glycerol-3-phosphate cytidylyltransferase
MIYCFDIDGTICDTYESNYPNSIPDQKVIDRINEMYDDGHTILFFTARGASSGLDWTEFTSDQLKSWGVSYHQLITNQKPTFDLMIDDKCIHINEWKKKETPFRGLIAGSFDVIHPGYIKMFKEAKTVCNYVIVALHDNPNLERPEKMKPTFLVEDRRDILEAIKYIDEIIIYSTENELINLIDDLKIDIRILGDDYKDKKYTAHNKIPVHYCSRNHGWSSTKFKNKIKQIKQD